MAEEVKEVKTNENKTNIKSPKEIIIETVKGIIADYKELMASSNDEILLQGFNNPDKNEDECVNYVMNNLKKERIYAGRDSLMYPFIHDYYVDDLSKESEFLKENWLTDYTSFGGGGSRTTTKKEKPSMADIKEAYEALSNEEKNKIYLEQLEKAKLEAKTKAEAKIKEEERKAKEKAKQKAEEEKKAREEALQKGAGSQMSLFDL